jgi:hypothetical protein
MTATRTAPRRPMPCRRWLVEAPRWAGHTPQSAPASPRPRSPSRNLVQSSP